MSSWLCAQCGGSNEHDGFCSSCQAFLWVDPARTLVGSSQGGGEGAGQRRPSKRSFSEFEVEPGVALRIDVGPPSGEITPGGNTVEFDVQIYNLSEIVDAYTVRAVSSPPWLELTSAEVRLLPNTRGTARIAVSIPAGILAPPGRTPVLLRVQSVTNAERKVEEPMTFMVSEVDAPVRVSLEPAIIHARNHQPGQFDVLLDNTASNRARRLVLTGRDPEGLVRFFFSPAVVPLPPGGSARVQVRVQAPAPEKGQQSSRQLTVAVSDGESVFETSATFMQVAIDDPPVKLSLDPSVLRVCDASAGQFEVVIDNSRGNRIHRVALSCRDQERLVRFSFPTGWMGVPAGTVQRIWVRAEAKSPDPGQEVSRLVTVLAKDGDQDIETNGTFVQTTSSPVVNPLPLVHLEPSLLRLRGQHGETTLVVENRGTTERCHIHFSARDAERALRFTFIPASLDIASGQTARVRVLVRARRPDGREEQNRPFVVMASVEGQVAEAVGNAIQRARDWRPWWRIALTLSGALMMAVGAVLNWNIGATFLIPSNHGLDLNVTPDVTGLEWSLPAVDAVFSVVFGSPLDLPTMTNHELDPLISAGSLIIALAVIAALGLTGPKGRLTQLATLLATVITLVFLYLVWRDAETGHPGPGAYLVLSGCAVAFIGGALGSTRKGP